MPIYREILCEERQCMCDLGRVGGGEMVDNKPIKNLVKSCQ